MTNFTNGIAKFTAGVCADDIAVEAQQMLQLSLLDWMAVAIAGAQEPVSKVVRQVSINEGGTGEASLIGSDVKLPARAAALVNGSVSHALDYDDTHFAHIGHTSVGVLPAALAMAQKTGASGRDFQTAALIGSEVAIRVGLWLGRTHYQLGYHQTATAGAFGAAMAAARLLALSEAQCAMVMGLVSTRASGLKAQFGTMTKPYNAGIAAANGVEAAVLVAAGMDARIDGIESPLGFSDTHHGVQNMDALDGLGQSWIFEDVSHKFHACCHGLHASLEAARMFGNIVAAEIETIEVHTNTRWIGVCDKPAPDTGLGAKFSYSTVLAMHFLGYDTGALDSYRDALCADRDVVALRGKVSVIEDGTIGETATRLVICLRDGSRFEMGYDLNAPMEIVARRDKVLTKARGLLDQNSEKPRADAIWKLVMNYADPEAIGAALNPS